ncbi:MAG: autotransporter outer membrane beta-barrel domain-containing protein [Gammaproteobacteria bacterium]|nr:autotransporter outer membrane beta-barrel domain-containing protein [Gammaproteobacteria bacterium]
MISVLRHDGFLTSARSLLRHAMQLLACALTLNAPSALGHENSNSSDLAPTLIDAIADQTLHLNPKVASNNGSVEPQRIYVRDLRLSFGQLPSKSFSAYPYNKAIADAWVVDSYLIVLAKALGTAQIAVTATNEHGSMIDWFLVNVEDRRQNTSETTKVVAFEKDVATVPLNLLATNTFQLPKLNSSNVSYLLTPALPIDLSYDRAGHFIRGRINVAMPSEPYFWIGVTEQGNVAIQQFKFEPRRASLTNANDANSFADLVTLNVVNSLTSVPSRSVREGDLFLYQSQSEISPIAASRPMFSQSSTTFASQHHVLDNFASALRSRFRVSSPHDNRAIGNSRTLWNYASSRIGDRHDGNVQAGFEPGIYVGFDTQVEGNWTTGLAFGFDRQSTNNVLARETTTNSDALAASFSSVMPYARWDDQAGREIWGTLGVVRGLNPVPNYLANPITNPNQGMIVGAVGWRQLLRSSGNVHLSSTGDAGLTMPVRFNELEENHNALDPVAGRLRTGLEMSYTGQKLQPYLGLSGRLDDDPFALISSVEALGGVRFASFHGLTLEAEGRALSDATASSSPELIFSVAAHLDPGLRGEGLALSLSPTYGQTNYAGSLLPMQQWSMLNPQGFGSPYENEWAMSGTLSYGLPVNASGVITPFGQISISTLSQTRMGFRVALNSNLDRLFNLEIATRQMRSAQQQLDQGVDIQLRFVF